MAAVRSKAQAPVGSAQWILNEQRQAAEYADLEVEEFTFSARNEMEWLNEHMAEVFSQTQFEVAEIFKTPGKLRGKTPRTARKNAAPRAPLTDVFTSNTPTAARTSPSRNNQLPKNVVQFEVAEDKENHVVQSLKPTSRFSEGAGKENTDSGYHDMTEEETDVEHHFQPKKQYFLKQSPPKSQLKSPPPAKTEPTTTSRDKSDESFVSAEEIPISQIEGVHQQQAPVVEPARVEPARDEPAYEPMELDPPAARVVSHYSISAETESAMDEVFEQIETKAPSPSISESSSPERPELRKKSSLTFASLPAREPLSKKSLANMRSSRQSQFEGNRAPSLSHSTYVAKSHYEKPPADAEDVEEAANHEVFPEPTDQENLDNNRDKAVGAPTTAEETRPRNTTATLQERIKLLGQSKSPRPSKSISALAAKQNALQRSARNVPSLGLEPEEHGIGSSVGQPMDLAAEQDKEAEVTLADQMTKKQHATTAASIPQQQTPAAGDLYPKIKDSKLNTVSNEQSTSYPTSRPQNEIEMESTTPAGSPSRSRTNDGPLSQSKAKLYSVLKSAKGIFASSAGVSAQAKMEALSSPPKHGMQPQTSASAQLHRENENQQDRSRELYPSLTAANHAHAGSRKTGKDGKEPDVDSKPYSSEENSGSVAPKSGLETVTHFQEPAMIEETGTLGTAPVAANEARLTNNYHERPETNYGAVGGQDSTLTKPQPSVSGVLKQSEPRRPTKQSKEASSKARPAPVSIKVKSQMVGHVGQSNPNLASSVHDSYANATSAKPPTLSKKASNSSLHTTSSTQSFKTAGTSTSRPKALEAAARKKEQDEREAQRKAEQKREMERKRAARAEEEKKLAQEKALEQQRAAEAQSAAQRQAADRRKAEVARKNEQLKAQSNASKAQQIDEMMGNTTATERPQHLQSNQRPELGVAPRPMPRGMEGAAESKNRPPVPHVNPAKPPKRQLQHDVEQEGPVNSAADGQPQVKRMRPSEDELTSGPQRPTMGAPIRLSTMRKDAQNKFTQLGNGQMSSQNASSMHKTVVTAQHGAQHPKTPHINDLAKYSNARIPFAEAPNPPQGPPSQQYPSRMQPLVKTPATAHKSSPQYPNGDNIELPDIATDSEDSDDDDGFVPPDWANSPALRELLSQQQLVDPLKVFGPIAPLSMEEVFKGSKERQAKFRARTSSANWNGPDRLTEEERRKDREARERLERDGAWTFGNSV